MRGARPLTVDYFVIVVRMSDIGWFHVQYLDVANASNFVEYTIMHVEKPPGECLTHKLYMAVGLGLATTMPVGVIIDPAGNIRTWRTGSIVAGCKLASSP